jgi:hypothetical protein
VSAPVVVDDIVTGAVSYLLAQPDVTASVSRINIGGQFSPAVWPYQTWAVLENSSATACVISSDGGWAGANIHNTLRFPRLQVSIWADPNRDPNTAMDVGETRRRAERAWLAVDRHLHRTAGDAVMFGALRVIESTRLTEPIDLLVPDGDGLLELRTYYAITQG